MNLKYYNRYSQFSVNGEHKTVPYVTLPSNSSMNFFPNNTLSSFTTKLQHQISLDGLYEVALTEIILPFNWTIKLKGKIKNVAAEIKKAVPILNNFTF